MPEVTVEGEPLLLLTPQMAGIALRELGKPVGSLAHLRYDIIAAIDLLITGI
ncbi:CcdB protein [compost metagenome]